MIISQIYFNVLFLQELNQRQMKNLIYTISILVSSFLLSSCGSTSSNTTPKTNPHAEAHMEMHREFQQEQIQKELDQQNKETMEPSKAEKQKFLIAKNQKGIDFYAAGNEPFWSLDMDFDKGFQFKNLDGLEFKTPVAKPDKAMDANVIRYRSVTESGEIIIQLNQTECSDTMSGQKFGYTVTVDVKTNKNADYKTYKGCGDYVPDFRLHDIWAITEVDGMKVIPENFKGETPRLEIKTSEERVFGHDGCNSFNGSVKTEAGKIIFGNLISTMIACFENTDVSSKIGSILSGNSLNYTIENNQLILTKDSKKVMVLKHID